MKTIRELAVLRKDFKDSNGTVVEQGKRMKEIILELLDDYIKRRRNKVG